jgi:hypothetical protein
MNGLANNSRCGYGQKYVSGLRYGMGDEWSDQQTAKSRAVLGMVSQPRALPGRDRDMRTLAKG